MKQADEPDGTPLDRERVQDLGEPPVDRRKLIQDALACRPRPISAHTYVRRWETSSKPVALLCDDGQAYITKARQNGKPEMSRVMITEQVVARLGALLDASVSRAALVQVSAELIGAQKEMNHMEAGVCHGSRQLDDVSEHSGFQHVQVPENRMRFARLAVLYGWVSAADHQFVYSKSSPHLVYSVDHGHFFPNGFNWNTASLTQAGVARLDSTIAQNCKFSDLEIRGAIRQLLNANDKAIAEIVAVPPDEWGLSLDERVALSDFLATRAAQLLASIPPDPNQEGNI